MEEKRGSSEVVLKRAGQIVTENARVFEAVEVIKERNAKKLFNASHDSLRDDFEVTNDALNIMAACARA